MSAVPVRRGNASACVRSSYAVVMPVRVCTHSKCAARGRASGCAMLLWRSLRTILLSWSCPRQEPSGMANNRDAVRWLFANDSPRSHLVVTGIWQDGASGVGAASLKAEAGVILWWRCPNLPVPMECYYLAPLCRSNLFSSISDNGRKTLVCV